MRLMAAGDYMILPDPTTPGQSAVYLVDDEGRKIGEPLAAGFRNRDAAERWIRARHNLPPNDEPQGALWEPE